MMNLGDKVVCVDDEDSGIHKKLKVGEIYTIIDRLFEAYYFAETSGGWYQYRFRSLEEMQNTNFVSIAKGAL
jgi:hypothetical protein